MVDFWDRRYAQTDFAYGTSPNVWFAEQLAGLPCGKLLLPAEGEGRNATHAAQLGWQVTAFDWSREAQKKATLLASSQGVSIDYQVGDAHSLSFEPESFDAIGLIYAHWASPHREAIHARVVEWLRPGGTIILEAFSPSQIELSSGGPKRPELLYTEEQLAKDFCNMSAVSLASCSVILDEGHYHQGLASVIRMIALK